MVTTFAKIGEYQHFVVLDATDGHVYRKVGEKAFQTYNSTSGIRYGREDLSFPPDTRVCLVVIPIQ